MNGDPGIASLHLLKKGDRYTGAEAKDVWSCDAEVGSHLELEERQPEMTGRLAPMIQGEHRCARAVGRVRGVSCGTMGQNVLCKDCTMAKGLSVLCLVQKYLYST